MRSQLIFGLSLVGIFDASYLLWVYTSHSRPMLCLGTGCDEVRESSYAVFLGLPLPLYGVFMYASIALLVFGASLRKETHGNYPLLGKLSLYAIVSISGMGFLASAALTAIEAFVIYAWCIWCIISAFVVTLLFVLAVLEVRNPSTPWVSRPVKEGEVCAVGPSYLIVLGVAVIISIPVWMFLTLGSQAVGSTEIAKGNLARLHRPDSHWQGLESAELTVVEFADLECRSCANMEPVMERIRETYGQKIRYTLRHFPLTKIHANSWKAAEAAECAASQGKYWEAIKILFSRQQELQDRALKRYASRIGLELKSFNQCLDSGEMAERIRRDRDDGLELGVKGTPTFFVGQRAVTGQISYGKFSRMIDEALDEAAMLGIKLPVPLDLKVFSGAELVSAEKAAMANGSTVANLHESFVAGEISVPQPPGPMDPGNLLEGANSLDIDSSLSSFSRAFGACSEGLPPEPPSIDMEETYGLFLAGGTVLFLDVRDPGQFSSGHIRGAINLPATQVEARLSRLPKDHKIVIYGQSTSTGDPCAESRSTGRLFLENGFSENLVAVFADGYESWVRGGYPSEKGP